MSTNWNQYHGEGTASRNGCRGRNNKVLYVVLSFTATVICLFCRDFVDAVEVSERVKNWEEEQQANIREKHDNVRKRYLGEFQRSAAGVDDEGPFDFLNCPNRLSYHHKENDEATTKSKDESLSFFSQWRSDTLNSRLSYGTIGELLGNNPRSILKTIESGGKFIYWQQRPVKRDVPPVIDMSLFNGTILENENRTTLGEDATIILDSKTHTPYTWNLIPPVRRKDFKAACHNIIELPQGPKEYIVFASGWHTEYQHILIDHIGYWTFLKDTFPLAHFVFMMDIDSDMPGRIMSTIDPDLYKRVIFLRTRERYAPYGGNQILQAPRNTPLSVVMPLVPTRHLNLIENARRWIWNSPQLTPKSSSPAMGEIDERRTIIYYHRKEGGSRLGRFLNYRQQEIVIQSIKHAMVRYNRPERFVLFDGEGVTLEEQVELFRSASIVIGPHGGALANLMFAPPLESCDQQTKVIEFVTSSATPRVQEGDYSTTYYYFYSTIPWVELHQVFYVKPSLGLLTYLDMDGFHDALESVMSDTTAVEQKYQ